MATFVVSERYRVSIVDDAICYYALTYQLVMWVFRMVKVDGKIIATFGDWVVTEHGIECIDTYYFIAKERLHEPDWIYHVCQKTWVNKVDFENAFNHALDVHNVISHQKDHY